MAEEFAPSTDIHYEEKFVMALKSPMQLDEEGMVELLKHFPLAQNRFYLVFINQLVLAEDLDRVESTSVLLPRQDNLAEAAAADDAHLLEIVNRDILLLEEALPWLSTQFYRNAKKFGLDNVNQVKSILTSKMGEQNCPVSQS